MMKQLNLEQMKSIQPLFTFVKNTLVDTCIRKNIGKVWADDDIHPNCVQVFVGDFCFLAGDSDNEQAVDLIKNIPLNYPKNNCFMVAENQKWEHLIETEYGVHCHKVSRYSTKNNVQFDHYQLRKFVNQLPKGYRLAKIDSDLYNRALQEDWSRDFCVNFRDFEDFSKNGLGIVITYGKELVGGASSYIATEDTLEVEIAVKENYRHRGFATICAAQLILQALSRGMYPSWDAANLISFKTAEKLGYELDQEYTAFVVDLVV